MPKNGSDEWYAIDHCLIDKDSAHNEYGYRTDNIKATETGILQFLGIIFATLAVITAAGVSGKYPFLFLINLVLLIIGNLYVAEKRWVIWLNAAYMKKYLENDQTGLWWEHRLSELRGKVRSPVGGIKYIELLLFITIGLAEAVLFVAIPGEGRVANIREIRNLLPAGLLIGLLVLAIRNYHRLRTGHAERDLFEALPGYASNRAQSDDTLQNS